MREFKENKNDPEMIGKSISALSNSAALENVERAYMVWGINDVSHEITGTTFNPFTQKVGSDELLNWLRNRLSRNMEYSFKETSVDGRRVVVLMISPPYFTPATYDNLPYIRDGSSVKLLSKLPNLEKALWKRLNMMNHELMPAKEDLTQVEVLSLLDCDAVIEKLEHVRPTDDEHTIDMLVKRRFVKTQNDGLLTSPCSEPSCSPET